MAILDKIFIVYVNDQIYFTCESQIGAEEFVKDRLSKEIPYELFPLIGKIHKLEEMFDDQRGQDCVVHNELDEKIKVLKYDFEQCQRYYGKELGNINYTFEHHEETFKLLHEQIFHLNQLIAGLKND